MPTKPQHSRPYDLLPEYLRQVREAAGLTQRELGERLGKPHSWVFKCETKIRRVDVGEFILWCEACGVKPQRGLLEYMKVMKRNS